MIEFEEYKSKLNDLKPKLEELRAAFVPQSLLDELERLHAMAEAPGFWDDPARSQKAVMRTKTLERKRDKFQSMCSEWDDLMTICEMALEENDDSMLEELTAGYAKLEADMEEARLETLLTGEYDANNALLSFHAGAGGTEAQDWCAMLYRMYTRWAEAHGFTYKILDYLDGDEAGLKSADIMIEGDNAYGFLKGEAGVHRLVRVSPFDAAGRRHTSFSAVEVIPEIPDDVEVEIRPEDIEMQVYRTSTRRPPPSDSSISRPASSSPARRSATSSSTRKRVCACCARSSSRSRSASTSRKFPTSRACSRRSSGAARSAPTSSCPTPS